MIRFFGIISLLASGGFVALGAALAMAGDWHAAGYFAFAVLTFGLFVVCLIHDAVEELR